MFSTETRLWKRGVRRLAGVDEAGRGPLAGPVIAAAVVLPAPGDPGYRAARRALGAIRDSKQLGPAARETFAGRIREHALAWGLGVRDVEAIDQLNILRASLEAMRDACWQLGSDGCSVAPDLVLVDGIHDIPGLDFSQEAMVGGDALAASIAAASILAKVHRDGLMVELHGRYPVYGFDRNKGYGTRAHLAALVAHGPCPAHRRTFRPVQDAMSRPLGAV